ncbi:MAG: undecaprenyl/decaprenyl-phosphate alpha-N-acetylglucosaminyl 1-phosphate transferase [Bacteroidaceae bacterium]|nr:undecaprenyl/decaprenyl-phosphate alpha-N-acetylglucosaminyl 1-phosphate transferase [Bacteroidaceae bacterium]
MNVLGMIVPVLVSAALTALMVPLIIRLSYRKRLFDTVDERTVHSGVVPRLGGSAFILSVVVAVVIAVLMSGDQRAGHVLAVKCGWPQYAALIGSALIIYLTGLWDDIRRVNYKKKFVLQFVSALLIVVVGNFWINDFYGLFGIWELSPVVGKTLSVLLIMYVINAFNLIDGIDGLASALGIIASVVTGALFLVFQQQIMAVLSFALAVSLAVFFCFNKFGSTCNHTKIFMGDGGSQTMGLIIAFLVVYMSMRKPGEAMHVSALHSPVITFCLIIIPCFDAVRVMIGRIRRGRNPFLPDKTHIHHKFLRMGYSSSRTLVSILLLDVLFVGLNTLLTLSNFDIDDSVKINLTLVLDVIIWWSLHRWLNCRIHKRIISGR